jgi:hypothetical protein
MRPSAPFRKATKVHLYTARTLERWGLSCMDGPQIRRIASRGVQLAEGTLDQVVIPRRRPTYVRIFRGETPMRIHNLYTNASSKSHFRGVEMEWVE